MSDISESVKKLHWLRQIDSIVNKKEVAYAKDTLLGIRNVIQNTGKVTDNQIQAIKNIIWGIDDADYA